MFYHFNCRHLGYCLNREVRNERIGHLVLQKRNRTQVSTHPLRPLCVHYSFPNDFNFVAQLPWSGGDYNKHFLIK